MPEAEEGPAIPHDAFQGLDKAKSRIQAAKDADGSNETQNFSQAICHSHYILTILVQVS